MPPPGAGLTLLQMLSLLEPFDLAALGHLSPRRAHLELQAMRLALVDRAAYLADPAFTPVPVAVCSMGRTLRNAARSSLTRRLGQGPRPGRPELPGSGADMPARTDLHETGQTTHFVTADRWGNLVSCTSTVEDFFGSGIMVPGFGLLLNNELDDFDPRPEAANRVRPLARPASSMTPTLVLRDGQPWLALGSPGGPTIVTTVLQVLLRVIDDGLGLADAIAAPRWFAAATRASPGSKTCPSPRAPLWRRWVTGRPADRRRSDRCRRCCSTATSSAARPIRAADGPVGTSSRAARRGALTGARLPGRGGGANRSGVARRAA